MAARRVAKSAVDWVAFAERVPANQKDCFRAFKGKSDIFIAKVHRFPENLPQIDFAFYSSRLSNPAIATEFEKAYKALSIPYPKDKNNVKAKVDAEEKAALAASKKHIAEAQKVIDDAKMLLNKVKTLPPLSELTYEMHDDYFPATRINPAEKPTMWPHTKSYQPDNDPTTIP